MEEKNQGSPTAATIAFDRLPGWYMQTIGGEELLTREEERALADRIHGKDLPLRDAAREKLICANLRLVVRIAHDFSGHGLPLEDLVAEGNRGLIRAAEKFDPDKGAKFSSYAAWWIKQAMRRSLADQVDTIRIPVQTRRKLAKLMSIEASLSTELGRSPSNAELVEVLHWAPRTVANLRHCSVKVFSLDALAYEDGDEPNYSFIANDNVLPPSELGVAADTAAILQQAFYALTPLERLVVKGRFLQQKTLGELSAVIGKTRERVRQIEKGALRKMKWRLAPELGAA